MKPIGKLETGPCSGPHEFIIGQYGNCLSGACHRPRCVCGSHDTEPFTLPKAGAWHCRPCGHVFWPAVR
jgi:hypothetical protein